MTIEQEKEKIRQQIREKLSAQSPQARANKSKLICQKLKELAPFKKAQVILFYLSAEQEVETLDLVRELLREKRKIAVPAADQVSRVLKPYFIRDLEKDVQRGTFGILEPKVDQSELVQISDIDLVIVPGLAFDQSNYRLGRGKGYYDRFLAKLPLNVPAFGLAFDFQIVPKLPVTELDVKLTRVIHN